MKEDIISKIAERLSGILGKDASEFSADTIFDDLKLKSMNYSQLTTFLEDAFDVEIPYMDFKRKKTVGEAADYIVSLVEG